MPSGDRKFRYLDDDQDRIALLADIRRTRRAVADMAERLPERERYMPRYFGWTMGALLAELSLSDRLTMAGIQLALLGVPPLIFYAARRPGWDQRTPEEKATFDDVLVNPPPIPAPDPPRPQAVSS